MVLLLISFRNKIRELSSRTGSEKFVQEQIAVSAISFSCSYFDLADQVFNTPLNVDLSEEAGLSKPIKNCIDILNKWQTAFVTAQLYLAEIVSLLSKFFCNQSTTLSPCLERGQCWKAERRRNRVR